jgi:methionyl-tRNA formyltransferase
LKSREKEHLPRKYLVAGCKPWNRRAFEEVIRRFPGEWEFVGSPEELTREKVRKIKPRFIFFLHWSWKVPEEIVSRHECVCFHMADVPYGRGGSPLQNLILRGKKHTKLTALRMTADFDAGPVYAKEDLCLGGGAEEIYVRQTFLAAEMIRRIIRDEPEPTEQVGKGTVFRRRRPEESEIGKARSIETLCDFLRMLDAETYPRAFIRHRGFRYEFSRAVLYDGKIKADVAITMDRKL